MANISGSVCVSLPESKVMSQSRVKFDRKHTNEEKLLRGKYQRLREKV